MTAVAVRRASHVHQVPQVGLPQSEPEASVSPVKRVPISAALPAQRSHAWRRETRYPRLATSTMANARYAVRIEGTCRYMIRCTSPWLTSRGATPRARTSPARSPSAASQPSTRASLRLPVENQIEEDPEEEEEDRLDREHQQQVARELAHVDCRLLPGREPETVPAVVVSLAGERPPEPEEPAQDEAEPEQARQCRAQALAVGPERELEEEDQEEREEEERVQRLLGAPLDREVLPRQDPRAPDEPHGASSVWRA